MDPLVTEAEVGPGVVRLTMNRPAQRNALDASLTEALASAVVRHGALERTRVLLIAAAGTAFCAGADLTAMLALGRAPYADNLADAERLARLLVALRESPKPTIACVQGPAFGGGVGLVAACDIAVASTEARFRVPEVQLGLMPAVISPYLVEAIGLRNARRYCLSAETIAADRARELGLVHEVVAAEALGPTALALAAAIAEGGPRALAAAKALLSEVGHAPPGERLATRTAELLATLRAGSEAQEGIAAALARRSPAWRR
ncbi:MAG TPA: enoyl-CoA hydratase-related protein [Steroidobacteraceae bacterium]|nr:enoyl-CoA hydratase-related protein [Steroidobacteraceae bacterium]